MWFCESWGRLKFLPDSIETDTFNIQTSHLDTMTAKARSSVHNFNNFICEKLQAKFINRHFYLKQGEGGGMTGLPYKRKVVHMPETCIISTSL